MDGLPDWAAILIVIGIIIWLVKAFQAILERRCPRCKRWFSRNTLQEEKFDERGLIIKQPRKVRYFYKCPACRHRWEAVKSINDEYGPDW